MPTLVNSSGVLSGLYTDGHIRGPGIEITPASTRASSSCRITNARPGETDLTNGRLGTSTLCGPDAFEATETEGGVGGRNMKTTLTARPLSSVDINTRVEAVDWATASTHLDSYGWAMLKTLLTADECERIAGLYEDDRRFRSHVVMARHGFGRGEYKYFP
jgi:hypothetical protein